MSSKLLTIGQASKLLGVSMQTMRRWDKSGKLPSLRKKATGMRYYSGDRVRKFIKNNMKEPLKLAKIWVLSIENIEPPLTFYCANSAIFQARLSRLESELGEIKKLESIFPLISAITGEIGNNSFDHNIGNWPDIPGIFFAYDLASRKIVLADRGRGILTTLRQIKPELSNHQDALNIAFTEIVSGRAPEARGNGLKFVKEVVTNSKISLFFQTGDAQLEIQENSEDLNIQKADSDFHGCLALIKF